MTTATRHNATKYYHSTLARALPEDVFTAARARVREAFARFPTVAVAFSGGKDSTCTLQLALEVARATQRLLHVVFCDEEIIDPDSLTYVDAVRQWPGITMHWMCAQLEHTLRSEHRTSWTTWDPAARAVWVRDPPPHALLSVPGLPGGPTHFKDIVRAVMATVTDGPFVELVGIRAGEALNRRRAVLGAKHWLTHRGGNYWYGKPIYDWETSDVWGAIKTYGWPYSRLYDKLTRYGYALATQRLGPWGNVAAILDTARWAALYPEMWARALVRVPELAPQARYGRTHLYLRTLHKPLGWTWQEWVWYLVKQLPPARQAYWKKAITSMVRRWERRSSVPFPEESLKIDGVREASPRCWKKLAHAVAKNDSLGGASRDMQ